MITKVFLLLNEKRRNKMKKVLAVMIAIAAITFTSGFKQVEAESSAPVAGGTVVSSAVSEIVEVANGWSVKKQIMGHDVYNDMNEKVGQVYDIIIAPDRAVSYAIIAAGGFLGIDKHDVAIPANQFKMQDNKIVLPGATKDFIKAMPEFKYAK